MSNRLLIGNLAGTSRIRLAKPGYDVTDPALRDEDLVYDSAWPEILNIHSVNWSTGGGSWVLYGSTGANYNYAKNFSFSSLPFVPMGLAWEVQYNVASNDMTRTYLTKYQPKPCIMFNNSISVMTYAANTSTPVTCCYMVFNKPLLYADPAEADNGGANSMLLGNHPTRGSGLWISRRGADVMTCGDADLTLSTLKQNLQVREYGSFFGTYETSGPYLGWIRGTLTLSQSYPNRPPILFRGQNNGVGAPSNAQIGQSEWGWISDNQIYYILYGALGSQNIYWAILDYDDTYSPGADSSPTARVLANADVGLWISKKNVNVTTASEGDLLLRTDRSVLSVKQRINYTNPSGSVNIGGISTETNLSAPPLTIFGWTWDSLNYCVPQAAELNPYRLYYRRGIGVPTPSSVAVVAGYSGNTVAYSYQSGAAGVNFRAAVMEHS